MKICLRTIEGSSKKGPYKKVAFFKATQVNLSFSNSCVKYKLIYFLSFITFVHIVFHNFVFPSFGIRYKI